MTEEQLPEEEAPATDAPDGPGDGTEEDVPDVPDEPVTTEDES